MLTKNNIDIDDNKNNNPKDFVLDVILNSQVRHSVFFLLYIYRELSLTDLSHLLDKSKPALHRHLQKMIEAGIITESKEVKVRGSIKAKYYKLVEEITRESIDRKSRTIRAELLTGKNPEKGKANVKKLLKIERAKFHIVNDSIHLITQLTKRLEEQAELVGDADWEQFLNTSSSQLTMNFLPNEALEVYQRYMEGFDQEKRSLEDTYETKHGELPNNQYVVVTITIPIQNLINFERKLSPERVARFGKLFAQK
ncbi:MAG: ArsR/SmtB family transcription factor [Candidatus Hodarchaeota archaeon]